MTATLSILPVTHRTAVADDPRLARITARDRTADGRLWYSVATTGIYCRPSCPSRAANPGNVQPHDTLAAAKATGFRPCKRCNPDGLSLDNDNATIVARACRLIAQSEDGSLSGCAWGVERKRVLLDRGSVAAADTRKSRASTP